MPTDRENAVTGLANTIAMSPTITNANEAVQAMQRRKVVIVKLAADPAAADATTNGVCNGTHAIQTSVFRKSKLVAARVIQQATVTADASNFATINVTKDDGAGGAQSVVLSNTTKPTANSGLGTLTAGRYANLTPSIVAAQAICDAGSLLQLQVTKGGTGVVVTVCAIELDFEEV